MTFRVTLVLFFFKQKTAYEVRISDWSSTCALPIFRVLLLPSPFGIPVAAAWIRDDRRGLVALGTACRPTVEAAVSKALVEAYAVLAITIDLADPDGPTWRSVADGTLPAHL